MSIKEKNMSYRIVNLFYIKWIKKKIVSKLCTYDMNMLSEYLNLYTKPLFKVSSYVNAHPLRGAVSQLNIMSEMFNMGTYYGRFSETLW